MYFHTFFSVALFVISYPVNNCCSEHSLYYWIPVAYNPKIALKYSSKFEKPHMQQTVQILAEEERCCNSIDLGYLPRF